MTILTIRVLETINRQEVGDLFWQGLVNQNITFADELDFDLAEFDAALTTHILFQNDRHK